LAGLGVVANGATLGEDTTVAWGVIALIVAEGSRTTAITVAGSAVAVAAGGGGGVGLGPTTPAETNAVSKAAVPAMMPPTAVNTPGRVDQNDFAPEGFDSGCDSGIG
jgi:hypothetical protein